MTCPKRDAPMYTWLKDGKPKGFFKDEHSLLVSYDMMPIIGLDQMRKSLNEQGQIVRGKLLECVDGSISVAFRHGKPDLTAIDWGCSTTRPTPAGCSRSHACLRTLCSYVSYIWGFPKENKFNIADEDNLILREFVWRSFSDDGRRRRPLARLKPAAEAVLLGLGFDVRAVEFAVYEE